MNFRTRFDHHEGHTFFSDLPSKTDPQYQEDCDINHVVALAMRGNVPDYIIKPRGSYGDVSELGDFRHMMDVVDRGKAAFLDVPSEIRARFGNDPRAFFDFCADPSNSAELVRLGLAEYAKPEEAAPVKVEVVSSAAPKASA